VYELRSHLGGGHPLVAQEVKFLGAIYQKEEMYADALACYEEAAGMFSRVLGPHHPQTAQALNYQVTPLSGLCVETSTLVREGYDRNCLHHVRPRAGGVPPAAGKCVETSPLVRKGYDRNCLHHVLEVLNNAFPPPSNL
jgi:hypothetical protein